MNMKKTTRLAIAVSLVLAMLMPVHAAEPQDEFTARMIPKIHGIFGDERPQYRIFDDHMEDISDLFFERNIDYYAEQKLEYILDDIRNNVLRIEKTTEEIVQSRTTGDLTINVNREFTQKLEIRSSGGSQYVVFMDGAMVASYVTNKYFGMIMSAEKPSLSPVVYFYGYAPPGGWVAVVAEKTAYSPVYGNNNQIVTFKLDIGVRGMNNGETSYSLFFPTFTVSGTYSY